MPIPDAQILHLNPWWRDPSAIERDPKVRALATRRIVASILGRHMSHAALGVLLGVGLTVLAAGGIRSVRVALGIVAFTTIMMLVVLMAAVGPMRRALRVQPGLALKGD